jgi:hypothetical protein
MQVVLECRRAESRARVAAEDEVIRTERCPTEVGVEQYSCGVDHRLNERQLEATHALQCDHKGVVVR